MKNWIVGLLLCAGLPLAWKVAPDLWGKVSPAFNEFVKSVLRKLRPFWKDHAVDVKRGLEEVEKELEEDVDDVNKENHGAE